MYGAAQNYIASKTSAQSRITNHTIKQLTIIGYPTWTMIGFRNVRMTDSEMVAMMADVVALAWVVPRSAEDNDSRRQIGLAARA